MRYITLLLTLLLFNCKSTDSNEASTPTLEKATVVSYENLDADHFAEAIAEGDVVVIDVRTPEEIAGGKIDDAMELNYYDTTFADQLLTLDKDQEYYIYCKGGGRSAKTCRLMINNGFKNVHNLEGGYTSWKDSGKN
ncbi:rhodanese-like domain-containing protein [Portibacter marinus]|uniref:rhodanese-like domain-containing protein n=1 Tax=Portibacter marinus TaxID=2898660 RepID=UPI001F1AA8D0|nr:rhodanese-like domain-containing protein [Portibacter marinus]